ncbi:N-acetylmuramoyl-L-alanine amidase [Shouchella patagoniensis]|uniref:N-acetylmuramoyl-L-alanine amidase n=1 Tax=Shouchella patagoniensis TaxID=228576 RepID=UPI00099519B1|nr:N-acetylmuramoyl-L-alanine amidase [Shouchella patagoniensis]
MAKIAICAGHGGSNSTPGKRTPAGEYEWNFNDKVVRAAVAVFEASGHKVRRFDDASGKTDVSLQTRTNAANAWGADIYISIHHNAMTGVWYNHAMGIETFTQNGSHPESEKLAAAVHPLYLAAMGLRDRGIKKANLHINRETRMPSILTEGGFMDSRVDIVAMRDNSKLKAQGEAIAAGAIAYLGGKVTVPNESQVGGVIVDNKPAPSPSAGGKTDAQLADEVIAGKHGSGDARKKSLGNRYDAVQALVNQKLSGSKPAPAKPKKSISQMATEVLNNQHGNGHDNRRRSLGISQAEYEKVRAEVNRRAGGGSKSPAKSVDQMAREVIAGKHGNGHDNRRRSLGISQAQYNQVRARVNQLA